MLPSQAAGEEVRFECNLHALAVDPSHKAHAAVTIGIKNHQSIRKTVPSNSTGVVFSIG
jgi:hypothetical protein